MNRKDYKNKVSHEALENGSEILIDFDKLKKIAQSDSPVVPVAVQDVDTKEIVILAYANEQALRHTLKEKLATFWSTSRNELWVKGLTSGDALKIVDVRINCEQNSLLYIVKLVGKGSCHTKKSDGHTRFGCYYRSISGDHLTFVDDTPYT
jgi:phosphoribosyl-AMP cyclohydrolase